MVAQRVGHIRRGIASVDGGPSLRVVAATDVADDHEIGPRPFGEVCGIEPAEAAHAPALEGGPHGRIVGDVRATDIVTRRLEQTRERSHARAADGDEVDAPRVTPSA